MNDVRQYLQVSAAYQAPRLRDKASVSKTNYVCMYLVAENMCRKAQMQGNGYVTVSDFFAHRPISKQRAAVQDCFAQICDILINHHGIKTQDIATYFMASPKFLVENLSRYQREQNQPNQDLPKIKVGAARE